MNPYLDTIEVSKQIGVNVQTLRNWAKTGKIAHIKIGSRVFFTREQAKDLVKIYEPSGVPTSDEARTH